MDKQLNTFDIMNEEKMYKIKKPIRLIELFAGYGSQALALKYLGVEFEHWKICEWAIKSIQAYKDIHYDETIKYCSDDKEELIKILLDYGVSTNYNEPATYKGLKMKSVDYLRNVVENILTTKNLVNIMNAKGTDFNIIDKDKYEYIMTYSFPCLTNDSLILTEFGYKELKDVKVGDKVLTKSNTWQKVIKKFDNGIHQTYYVNGMGFENIHCTENHKFYVRTMYREWDNEKRTYIRKFETPKFKEIKDIDKNDYFGVPVIKEETKFHTNDLDFWYMLGMYLGDGWLPKKGNEIVIACNEKKLKKLKDNLPYEKYKYTYTWNGTCYRFRFANKEIRKFIEENIKTGSSEKIIPTKILNMPNKTLYYFYKGYLDSDGCKIGNNYQFTSINRNIIYMMGMIVNKLYKTPTKIYKTITKDKHIIENRIVNQKDTYMLRFKINKCKQDKSFYEDGYIWYPFNKITKGKIENVYNMEVENDHSYIVQNCISKNCQDLSLAGKGKGMADNNTRSGMLWEVERILYELKELNQLPQILLMENVPQVHGKKNIEHFEKWCKSLENLGYSNHWKDLIATNYEIPQTRNRTFMVSILGNYHYEFPKPKKLKLKLKDLLEEQVDEKYYLSDKMLTYMLGTNQKESKYNRNKVFMRNFDEKKEVAATITTCAGNRPTDNFIIDKTVCLNSKVNAKKRLCNDLILNNKVKEMDVIRHSYTKSRENSWDNGRNVEQNNLSPTLDTRCDCLGVVENLIIRKLTPKECFRLQGVKDEDFENISKNQSNSSLYHLAGDSIVVKVLMAIFKQFLEGE